VIDTRNEGDVQKPGRLSVFEWFILASSILLLPLVAMLLKRRGFRATEKFLASMSKSPADNGERVVRVRQVARMVSIAAHRGFFSAQCLEQAITLWWLLGLMGIDSRIRFGIYKSGEAVEAHAWVLYQDEIVIGEVQKLDDFTPLLDVTFNRN
jgi:hypothetical protein